MSEHYNKRKKTMLLIHAWLSEGQFVGRDPSADAWVKEMTYGIIRRYNQLDFILAKYVRKKPSTEVKAALLTGAYELLFMDSSKEHAAVNEAIQTAKGLLRKSDIGFCNAVLRKIARHKEQDLDSLRDAPLPVKLNHSSKLIHRWREAWGEDKMRAICEWNNTYPKTSIRIRSGEAEAYLNELSSLKVSARIHPEYSDMIQLLESHKVTDLPGFDEGRLYVQDPSTRHAVDLFDLKSGDILLDACAAPGGKLALLSEQVPEGEVVALDLYEDRLALVKQNVERLNLNNVSYSIGDAASAEAMQSLAQKYQAGFDAILLDVPCSNTGVIQRRPEARWSFDSPKLKALMQVQAAILEESSKLLKSGGQLVYSTCSIEAEEGALQVASFIEAHSEYSLQKEELLIPGERDCDGAYAALLRKN